MRLHCAYLTAYKLVLTCIKLINWQVCSEVCLFPFLPLFSPITFNYINCIFRFENWYILTQIKMNELFNFEINSSNSFFKRIYCWLLCIDEIYCLKVNNRSFKKRFSLWVISSGVQFYYLFNLRLFFFFPSISLPVKNSAICGPDSHQHTCKGRHI